MRNKKWILSILIAMLALPFFSSAVFAEMSQLEDGTYNIDYTVSYDGDLPREMDLNGFFQTKLS